MILELAWAGLIGFGVKSVYNHIYADEIEFKKQWKELMNNVKGSTNKDEQEHEILKYIEKDYGCDCIVSIPKGKSYKEFESLKDVIVTALGCDIKITQSPNKNSAYMRCFYNLNPEDEFAIKLKWEQIMHAAGVHNALNQTFTIRKLEQKDYGYDLEIDVPIGLSYEQLEKVYPIISRNFNNALITAENKQYQDKTTIKLITVPIPDNYPYKVFECQPQQIYLGVTHCHENITADLFRTPHMIIAGTTGAGKSVFLAMVITNMIINCTDKQLNLFFAQVSNKDEDFYEFKYLKHTKYYADSIGKALMLYKYLYEQIKIRSKLFSKYHVKNIQEYNKVVPEEERLPLCVCVNDEFGSFTPGSKKTDLNYQNKIDCKFYIEKIATEGRSAGIFLIIGIQRPDREHFDPFMKNLMTVVVAMRMENGGSSKVILGDDRASELPAREAIVRFGVNEYRIKTPYLTPGKIKKLVKPYYEKDHKYISLSLNKGIETSEKSTSDTKVEKESTPNNSSENTNDNIKDISEVKTPKKGKGRPKKQTERLGQVN